VAALDDFERVPVKHAPNSPEFAAWAAPIVELFAQHAVGYASVTVRRRRR
jgi:hypothetical protein